MKKLFLLTFLVSFTSTISLAQGDYFGLRAGTGFGFQILRKISNGYYDGLHVNSHPVSREPIFDFRYQPVYWNVGASAKHGKLEYGIEIGSVKFQSDKVVYDRRTDARMSITQMAFDMKYHIFEEPKNGLSPFVDGTLNAITYLYTDTVTPDVNNPGNGVILESRNRSYNLRLGIYVGADYSFSDRWAAYAKLGYGFEFCQAGILCKLGAGN